LNKIQISIYKTGRRKFPGFFVLKEYAIQQSPRHGCVLHVAALQHASPQLFLASCSTAASELQLFFAKYAAAARVKSAKIYRTDHNLSPAG